MNIGDLVTVKNVRFRRGLGLICEIPYGVPNCVKVFWLDEGKLKPAMKNDLEVVSESR